MDFEDWSPAQLAFVLGYRIDLRTRGVSNREAFLIGPTGRDHPTGHQHAWATLARLATWKRIDPATPPAVTPRALVDGKAQAA